MLGNLFNPLNQQAASSAISVPDLYAQLEQEYGIQGMQRPAPQRPQAQPAQPVGPQRSDFREMAGQGLSGLGNMLGAAAGALDQRLTNVWMPSNSAANFAPNQNPGIAGLYALLQGSMRGGY